MGLSREQTASCGFPARRFRQCSSPLHLALQLSLLVRHGHDGDESDRESSSFPVRTLRSQRPALVRPASKPCAFRRLTPGVLYGANDEASWWSARRRIERLETAAPERTRF